MRVLVTGSRDWPKAGLVHIELEKLFSESVENAEVLTVVHGGCPTGADAQAKDWARRLRGQGLPVAIERHSAKWRVNGEFDRSAGFRRNAEMVALGADVCLAFIHNESSGATHCSGLAEKAGIKTIIMRSTENMPYKRVEHEIMLENIRMIWRNFAGEKKLYNENGKRQFAIPLEEPLALELRDIGWNVRDNSKKVAEDPTKELLYHLDVTVKMDGKMPPRLFMITKSKNRRTPLDEDTVMLLDYAEFDQVDVKLRPFNWDVNGKQGVAAYLKLGYFTLHEDELDLKYDHIPLENERLEIENIIDIEGGEWVDDDDQKAIEA